MPSWLIGILVNIGFKLIGKGVDELRKGVEKTTTKIDDNIINGIDKIIEYKVSEEDTTIDEAGRQLLKEALTRIKV